MTAVRHTQPPGAAAWWYLPPVTPHPIPSQGGQSAGFLGSPNSRQLPGQNTSSSPSPASNTFSTRAHFLEVTGADDDVKKGKRKFTV
nr:uncharacterized protein LOC127493703 isoform X3 [Oryctolagus cuniculus]